MWTGRKSVWIGTISQISLVARWWVDGRLTLYFEKLLSMNGRNRSWLSASDCVNWWHFDDVVTVVPVFYFFPQYCLRLTLVNALQVDCRNRIDFSSGLLSRTRENTWVTVKYSLNTNGARTAEKKNTNLNNANTLKWVEHANWATKMLRLTKQMASV